VCQHTWTSLMTNLLFFTVLLVHVVHHPIFHPSIHPPTGVWVFELLPWYNN
jgi:hypothetical protein